MKLLTIAIPCYNSQDYMDKSIKSALLGGDDVEILIIDDGSKDATVEIANEYEKKYPGIVKAIHQENKGHGGAVNTGIENASGMYFRVLDSDDWLDEKQFPKVLKKLKELSKEEEPIDMFVTNYIYDKLGAIHKKSMRYTRMLPQNTVFGWDDLKEIHRGHYILMHSVIYKTAMLRECGIKLPEHTFYVDNIYVYYPMPYVKKMYYMNVDLYHYFIGREDQSVHESIMIRRIDQQILVNKIMADAYDLRKIKSKNCRRYMFKYLEIICAISTVLLIKSGTEENNRKKEELWKYIKDNHEWLHRQLKGSIMGKILYSDKKAADKATVWMYGIIQKVFGFN